MKSNKCLFSKTVFKSNIVRFLPFAAPLLIAAFIVFPLCIYNLAGRATLSELAGISATSDVFAIIFSGILGLLNFSYLFSANKCNAFHAFPVGRKALFVTGILSSYVLAVVPQLIGLATGIPAAISMAAKPAQFLLLEAVSILGNSLIGVATAALAAMLSGNLFAGVLLYGAINFGYAGAVAAWFTALNTFAPSMVIPSDLTEYNKFGFSPFVKLLFIKTDIEEAGMLDKYYCYIGIYAVVSVVVLVIAYLLYRRRRLECAGEMVAYKAEVPVLSVIAAVAGGTFFSMLLGEIFGFGNLGYIPTYIVFTLISFFAAQMVLKKSARVFAARQFVLWALTAIISLVAVLGTSVFITYRVPEAKSVKQVEVESGYSFVCKSDEAEAVTALHKALVEDETDGRTALKYLFGVPEQRESDVPTGTDYLSSEYIEPLPITLTYTLKNGRTIKRSYSPLTGDEKFAPLLDALEAKHKPETVFDYLADYKIDITQCWIYSNLDGEEKLLNKQQSEKLFELCKKDFDERKKTYKSSVGEAGKTVSTNIEFTFTVENEADVAAIARRDAFSDFTYSNVYKETVYIEDNNTRDEYRLSVSTLTLGSEAEDCYNAFFNE